METPLKRVERAADVRDFIIDWLRWELVGPAPEFPRLEMSPTGEEVLRGQDPPRHRYSCGILFPRGVDYSAALGADDEELRSIAAAESVDEGGEAAEDDENGDEHVDIETEATNAPPETDNQEVAATSQFLPTTMGVSFLVDVGGDLTVTAHWATYRQREVPVPVAPAALPPPESAAPVLEGAASELPLPPPSAPEAGPPSTPLAAESSAPAAPALQQWVRKPYEVPIVLTRGDLLGQGHLTRLRLSPEDDGRLVLDVVSRRWEKGDLRLITVTLLNDNKDAKAKNENCFFQCGFSVDAGSKSKFMPYPERPGGSLDDEERSLALLYRHRPTYAIGHGCAADWSIGEGSSARVRTEVMPVFHQAPVEAKADLEGVNLSMNVLASLESGAVVSACTALASAYEDWIAEREVEAAAEFVDGSEMRATAEQHFAECRRCLARVRDGIDLLASDAQVLEAFQGMNKAMVQQRAHYALSSEAENRRDWTTGDDDLPVPERPYKVPEYPNSTAWRPFQLAFVLMNLRPMRDPTSPSRGIVDIIWFPTGGGKTEAYLGLAAYTILLRRILDPENAGATILMRYTLRLLTTQQFQRAASLICALERMRRREPRRLGQEPISIGLWLGSGVTPNRNTESLSDYAALKIGDRENRFSVLSCPWCGVEMGLKTFRGGRRLVMGYRLEGEGESKHVEFRCEDPSCDFSGNSGLPIEVVDERIYQRPPTLIIGTVDKFATLPWQPTSRKLFGIDNPRARTPPDLIIQDELHLIAGPLGSMVGHYETIVDELCTRVDDNGIRIPPRIVASTATIARAQEQVHHVYGRPSFLFPPQALRAGESFFAFEGDAARGRTYVGVFGSAAPSHVTTQKVVLAALLQAPLLCDGPAKAIDPYWTLMCYFNSLRELGRGATLVQADVREYLNAVWHRIGLTKEVGGEEATGRRRFVNNYRELTSRMRSSEIPEVLQQLFNERTLRDREKDREVVDLCFATNMIQVGLDVPRLSVMTIVGQPKGASEYIQASSRIGRGRDKPGLVVTNFNPFKPRDRSHFESFRPFHENAYKYVEPTSVTPFALPVCDRAIHALAVTLARFWDANLREASDKGIPEPTRSKVRKIVHDRVMAVAPDEERRAMTVLDRFLDDWENFRPNEYGSFGAGGGGEPLMWPAGKPLSPEFEQFRGRIRATPSSMRNVDGDCEAFRMQGEYIPVGGENA